MIAILALVALIVMRLNWPSVDTRMGVPIVVDGDTLRFGGERIRLTGIDAPEYEQGCFKQGLDAPLDYPCGRRAREALVRIISGRSVSCTGSEHDRYGRLLAVCRAGDVELNRRMVETGWAVAYGGYADAEAKAREDKAGIWQGDFEQPRQWRRDHDLREREPSNVFAAFVYWLKGFFRPG